MFKWLFLYWYNNSDTPTNTSKINLWAYINIRLFKVKVSNFISYYILGLNNLELKKLKIFYKNYYFDYVYQKSLVCLIIFILLLSIYIAI